MKKYFPGFLDVRFGPVPAVPALDSLPIRMVAPASRMSFGKDQLCLTEQRSADWLENGSSLRSHPAEHLELITSTRLSIKQRPCLCIYLGSSLLGLLSWTGRGDAHPCP